MDKKNYTQLYVYRKLTLNIKSHSLKVNGRRKIHHTNTNQKKAGVTILILGRADFKASEITKDKEKWYIKIKG